MSKIGVENNSVITLLKQYKLKVTPARQAILGVLSNSHKPVSVEEIFSSKKLSKDINQVTVYRTLASFQKLNIVRPVDIRADAIHYELVHIDEHHHHIVCTSCGDIEDFKQCNVKNIVHTIMKSLKKFFKANDHSFELFGICKNCT